MSIPNIQLRPSVIEELETNLQDIYEMINDGTLEVHNKHGVMEMAV